VPKGLGRFGIPQLVGTPGEEDEEVEGQWESTTHFTISVKLAKEAKKATVVPEVALAQYPDLQVHQAKCVEFYMFFLM
jgi:hypothetical protein